MLNSSIVVLPCPPVTPARPWEAPVPRRLVLDNGVTVYLQHLPGRRMSTIQVHLGTGLHTETVDGAAAVMAACLDKGTRAAAAEDFTDLLAGLGIKWSTDTDHTGPSITCDVATHTLDPALHLIADAITGPALQASQVARQISRQTGQISHDDNDPRTRAHRELHGAMFDPAGRPGRPASGTTASLQDLAVAEVTGFYRDQVTASRTVVTIAGDLTGIDTDRVLSASFGAWQTPPAAPALPHRPGVQPPAALFVERPGAEQTYLLLAVPTISRRHRDWAALTIATQILGAPIGGRLYTRLREDLGLSYGMYGRLTDPVPGTGLFVLQGAVGAPHTAVALQELHAILNAAHDQGFTTAEFTAAHEGVLRAMPMDYELAGKVAANLTDHVAHGLGADFAARLHHATAELTADDVNRAFRRHIDTARITVIAVGDPSVQDAVGQYTTPDLRVVAVRDHHLRHHRSSR